MGRSRGGLSTKIHALVDADGLPIRLSLTPGQASDVHGAQTLLNNLRRGTIVLADKGYDADWIREKIEAQGAAPNIPDKSNRIVRHCFSKTLYKDRNKVERFFNKIKHYRRIATRYEKLGANFLAMVKLAAIRVWLRSIESTA
jgi:transposase